MIYLQPKEILLIAIGVSYLPTGWWKDMLPRTKFILHSKSLQLTSIISYNLKSYDAIFIRTFPIRFIRMFH